MLCGLTLRAGTARPTHPAQGRAHGKVGLLVPNRRRRLMDCLQADRACHALWPHAAGWDSPPYPPLGTSLPTSAMMRATRIHPQRVQRLTRRDKKPVSFRTAEAKVAGGFGEFDLADAVALRIENVDAIVAIAHPSGAGPKIAFDVTADAVRTSSATGFGYEEGGVFN
jgi:hypothetical protein